VTSGAALDLRDRVRDVPDFPKPGIVFKDLMPLVADAEYFRETINRLEQLAKPRRPDIILGAEARGFIFGGALADRLGCGFVPARKPGKLPAETVTQAYALEYGEGTLHMHADAIEAGDRVLLVDDLLATGGTAGAAARLVQRLGGEVVASLFLIELPFLGGRERLAPLRVEALLSF
jgi:adenine phosphoribosyltransferase